MAPATVIRLVFDRSQNNMGVARLTTAIGGELAERT